MKKMLRHITPPMIAALVCSPGIQAQSPRMLPFEYPYDARVNHIRTWEARAPDTVVSSLLTRPARDVRQTTQYFDGLGRPLQNVIKKGSLVTGGDSADLVMATIYDGLGREQWKYLPFPANDTGGNSSLHDGSFKLNPFAQQVKFYNGQLAGQAAETNIGSMNLNWAYGQILYEPSPLMRPMESFAPGSSWMGSAGRAAAQSRRSTKYYYWLNTASDSVRAWKVTDHAGQWGSYDTHAIYAAAVLTKTVTVDEQGQQVIEFKDRQGLLLLRKVQHTSLPDTGTGKGHAGWLCTYYIYDEAKNLRCVIQPKGVELARSANWQLNALLLAEQCFRTEYDARNRPIRKKVPGAGEVWTVYDQWDRPILSQDANLHSQHKWMFTKYDGLNRVILTGIYTNTTDTTLTLMQARLQTTNLGRFEHYTPGGSLPLYSMDQSFPVVSYANVLTVHWYDDHSWVNAVPASYRSFDATFNSYFYPPSNTTWPYPQPLTAVAFAKGQRTGGIVKTADGSTALVEAIFYDQQGRVVQTKAQNLVDGCDIITTQYDWKGHPLITVARIQKSAPNPQSHIVVTKVDYDVLGRMLSVRKTLHGHINGTNVSKAEQILALHSYDALGQLRKKILGNGLDSLLYDYNVRGWMRGVNRSYAKDSNSKLHYFGFELAYDKHLLTVQNQPAPYADTLFNGNIAGMLWKSGGDSKVRRYEFTYDGVNRLTRALFNQFTNNGFSRDAGIDFSVNRITYDANGNITSLDQRGWKPGGSVTVDSLLYTYAHNGSSNRLQNVWDRQNDMLTRLGDFRSSPLYMTSLGNNKTAAAVDYVYDGNGNMIRDRNKDIGDALNNGISYNHLNLPQVITFRKAGGEVKGTITYTYDALGNKLKKLVQEAGKPDKSYLYLGGALFENDTLRYISHEEGRLRFDKKLFLDGGYVHQFNHDYYLKDHLGNVRVVLTEQQDTAQYLASLELAYRFRENALFYNVGTTAVSKSTVPGGYPADVPVITVPDSMVSRLNGSSHKVGPAMVLRVMSGDKVDIGVKSFYRGGGSGVSTSSPVTDLLASLSAGIVGLAGGQHGSLAELQGVSSPLLGSIGSFRMGNNPEQGAKPKAYLNWILLGDQMQYVATGSGARVVLDTGFVRPLTSGRLTIPNNGFLYIYVSNETQHWNVYFDNLSIRHYTGPLLEENHYYPFGLRMEGIGSRAYGRPGNRHQYNGKEKQDAEFTDGGGLEWYDYGARMYDQQIGRWHVGDPLADSTRQHSQYNYVLNNPLKFIDPDGMQATDPGDKFKTIIAAAKDFGKLYNDNSIVEKREYGSTIYKFIENGKTFYSYSIPNAAFGSTVNPSKSPEGTNSVADIHSHGNSWGANTSFSDNNFSNTDKWNNISKKLDGFLTTPDGSLKMYNHKKREQTTISMDLPSDPNDKTRKNNINPFTSLKDEPKVDLSEEKRKK